MAERVKRARIAAPAAPRVTMGRMALAMPSLPLLGSQPSCTEKTSTSSSASTKLGMVNPATDSSMVMRSAKELRCSAA